MNSVNISGRLGKDAELRNTQGGSSILSLAVAVSDRKRNGQTGQWEDITHWIDVIVFGKRAEALSKILKKGSYVIVNGRLSQSKWEDKQGNKRSKIEVIANDVDLPPRPKDQHDGYHGGYGQQPNNYPQQQQYGPQNAPQQPTGGNYGYQQQGYQEPDLFDENLPF